MRYLRPLLFIASTLLLDALTSCFELFPEETVVYQGRIFDTTKPVDSVLVQGCTQQLSLFPNSPNCDTETLSDAHGYFYIAFKVDDLEGRGISYGKEGYRSLDSCLTLNDGTLECYIQPLPTSFYIYSPTTTEPFIYDSLTIQVLAEDRDTTVFYHVESFENTFGDTSFYWTTDSDLIYGTFESYTDISVPDNSVITLLAEYFKSDELLVIDLYTLFCPKGIGNSYKILH